MKKNLVIVIILSFMLIQCNCAKKQPQMQITTLEPDSGSFNGGTKITITGKNFQQRADVTIGNSKLDNIVVNALGNVITGVTPLQKSKPGIVNIIVINPDGTKSASVTYTYLVTYTDWRSPELACKYLTETGLTTGSYKLWSDNDYYAIIEQKVGSGFPLANSITYQVLGSENKVNELQLSLDVWYDDNMPRNEAHTILLKNVMILYQKALDKKLPSKIKASIINGKSGQWVMNNVITELVREDWDTGKGYELRFSIR